MRLEHVQGGPMGPRQRRAAPRSGRARPSLPEPEHLHVQRARAELAVASQALGHRALAPVDRVLEPAPRGELPGELLVGLDRAGESVDLRLELGHRAGPPLPAPRARLRRALAGGWRRRSGFRSSRICRSSSISEWISGSRARADRWSFASVARDSSSWPAISEEPRGHQLGPDVLGVMILGRAR